MCQMRRHYKDQAGLRSAVAMPNCCWFQGASICHNDINDLVLFENIHLLTTGM